MRRTSKVDAIAKSAGGRPIVFLDLDDVLATHRIYDSSLVVAVMRGDQLADTPELWENVFNANACCNLQLLHDEFSPRYVISSSWTLHLTREELLEVFARTGLDFVGENFHERWSTRRHPGSSRFTEIKAWLGSDTQPSARFIILDDERSGESIIATDLEKFAVFCRPGAGFGYLEMQEAQRILASG